MPLSLFKPDPGPCPVDDAPHTTCTSPDYGTAPLVAVVLPARDGLRTPRSAQTRGALPHGLITTATYTRAAWREAVKRTR